MTTTDLRRLSRFKSTQLWRSILPPRKLVADIWQNSKSLAALAAIALCPTLLPRHQQMAIMLRAMALSNPSSRFSRQLLVLAEDPEVCAGKILDIDRHTGDEMDFYQCMGLSLTLEHLGWSNLAPVYLRLLYVRQPRLTYAERQEECHWLRKNFKPNFAGTPSA